MSEDLNVFPNARSKLFGAGEDSVGIITTPATAGLTGDLDLSDGDTDFEANTPVSGVLSNQGTSNAIGVSNQQVDVTVNNSGSIVILYFAIAKTNGEWLDTLTWEVKEGATTLDSGSIDDSEQGGPAGGIGNSDLASRSDISIIKNVSAGAHTYDWIWGEDGDNSVGVLKAIVIEVDDTHAGFIQTVAVAGKNVITPDSHSTHEMAVLPG